MVLGVVLGNLLLGLVSGIAASMMYARLITARKARELRKQFGHLEGTYEEFVRNATMAPSRTRGTITLRYTGGTGFTTEAVGGDGKTFWHGELFMREDARILGEGYYSHIGRDDTGLHHVIYNPTDGHFNVSGENTSHPNGVKDFKTIWRRKL